MAKSACSAKFGGHAPASANPSGDTMLVDLPTFTLIHVVLSVLGIIAGLVVAGGLMAGARMDGWTAFFLLTTLATSVTGFFFPFTTILPSHITGVISLVRARGCLAARYGKQMEGGWRTVYAITAVTALYLNVFVLIVQLFACAILALANAGAQSPTLPDSISGRWTWVQRGVGQTFPWTGSRPSPISPSRPVPVVDDRAKCVIRDVPIIGTTPDGGLSFDAITPCNVPFRVDLRRAPAGWTGTATSTGGTAGGNVLVLELKAS